VDNQLWTAKNAHRYHNPVLIRHCTFPQAIPTFSGQPSHVNSKTMPTHDPIPAGDRQYGSFPLSNQSNQVVPAFTPSMALRATPEAALRILITLALKKPARFTFQNLFGQSRQCSAIDRHPIR